MEHNKGFERAQRAYERQLPPGFDDPQCPHEGDDDCQDKCDNCKYNIDPEELAEIEEENRAEYNRLRRGEL